MNERERDLLESILDTIEGILLMTPNPSDQPNIFEEKQRLRELTARLNEARRKK